MNVGGRCSTRSSGPPNRWASPRSPTSSESTPTRFASTSRPLSATASSSEYQTRRRGQDAPGPATEHDPAWREAVFAATAMLAEILLSHLSATSDDPATAATAAGRAWGAHLVPRPAPSRQVTRDDAVNRLTAMLRDLDFAPEPVTGDDGSIRPDPPAALPVPRARRTAPGPRLPRALGPDAGRADRTPRARHRHRTDPLRRDHRVPSPPHASPRPPRGTLNVVDAAGPPTRHQRRLRLGGRPCSRPNSRPHPRRGPRSRASA